MTIAETDDFTEYEEETGGSIDEMVSEEVDIDAAIEAILFAAGHPLTYAQLAKPFEMSPSLMRERVYTYAQSYNHSDLHRGIILLAFEETCQLCTKQEYLQHIRVALGIRKSGSLSTSCIEALAIIAYNQPTTRAYVDAVRAVDSTYAVTTLLERGLIEAKGRLDAPGRPVLYGTTDGFLRSFGLSSLDELPGISSEESYEVLAKMGQTALGLPYDADQMTIDDAGTAAEPTESASDPEAENSGASADTENPDAENTENPESENPAASADTEDSAAEKTEHTPTTEAETLPDMSEDFSEPEPYVGLSDAADEDTPEISSADIDE